MQHMYPESASSGDIEPAHEQSIDTTEENSGKVCSRCGEWHPLSHYLKRSGRRSGRSRRRGTCRACRKQLRNADAELSTPADITALHHTAISTADQLEVIQTNMNQTDNPSTKPLTKRDIHNESGNGIVTARPIRSLPSIQASDIRGQGLDLSVLRPTRRGIVHMRGRTDKGRRWHQETDLETAITLVKEYAAVVVNRHTIRRLYSNRSFRKYILERDHYTCYFCGGPGDTIDHLLPRARGGHTTPLNCVCACNLCNQAKADHDLNDFIQPADSERS